MLNVYVQGSHNQTFIELDRPQRDLPAACVIAQQYSSVDLILLPFISRKGKFGVRLKKKNLRGFFFSCLKIVKVRAVRFRKSGSACSKL
jgi:hypothetical protein